jgi:phospholipid/cholesterol/gamma-HCH transport system substrate-binding protein
VADGRKALRVGALMVIGLAILAAAIFSIGGGVRWLSGSEELRTHFSRVNGLQTGAPVMLSGVNVGSVSSIEFPPDPRANYVVVRLRIDANAMPRVRADSVAKIESMGLLGDKFLLITAGSPTASSIEAGSLLRSQDPINYAAFLETRGTSDLVANVLAISASMRQLLDAVNQGNGVLAQLIKGPSNPKEKAFDLASAQQTMDNLARVSAQLNVTTDRINRGEGLLGALLSPETNGKRMVANLTSSVDSLRQTTDRLNETSIQVRALATRLDTAQGLLPQLMEDRRYAEQVMGNLQRSSDDLRQILDKINSGQGTMGLLVNDPSLYNNTTKLVGASGWGVSLLKSLYSLTHPFSSTVSPTYAQPNQQQDYRPAGNSSP